MHISGSHLDELEQGMDAGGDGDDGKATGFGGGHVGGSVSQEADAGAAAELARLLGSPAEDLGAALMAVAEGAEGEKVGDAGSLELGPADALQVAAGHTQDLSRPTSVR